MTSRKCASFHCHSLSFFVKMPCCHVILIFLPLFSHLWSCRWAVSWIIHCRSNSLALVWITWSTWQTVCVQSQNVKQRKSYRLKKTAVTRLLVTNRVITRMQRKQRLNSSWICRIISARWQFLYENTSRQYVMKSVCECVCMCYIRWQVADRMLAPKKAGEPMEHIPPSSLWRSGCWLQAVSKLHSCPEISSTEYRELDKSLFDWKNFF